MKFIGRETELRLLQKMYDSAEMQTCVLYGRRRIGKSELIKHSLKEQKQKWIYYECKQTTEDNNAESLSNLISDVFNMPGLHFRNMEGIFRFLFTQAKEEPMILVIDEYPYLISAIQGIDSILQSLINEYRTQSKIKLVLCGSYVDTMKSLLESENPLFGRIDRIIHLKAMDYYDSSKFYESYSEEDKVRLYSVFGGIPYYNQLIDPSLSVRDNTIELIASPNSRLENEVSMYLRSEIHRITNANEVIETLAKGYSRFSDILSQSHVSSSPTLVDVLEKLTQMEIVEKSAPINDEKNRRKAGYYISDPLSMFYFRYCFRYASQRSVLNPEVFYDRYINQDFETWYVPHFFETVCRQYLIRQNRSNLLAIPFDRIGRYWYDDPVNKTNGEFDLVTEDSNGYIFYEVKFRKDRITQSYIDMEMEQVKKTGLNCYRFGFISRSGFDVIPNDSLILIHLKDLYQ